MIDKPGVKWEVTRTMLATLASAVAIIGAGYAYLDNIRAEAQDVRERVSVLESRAATHRDSPGHPGAIEGIQGNAVGIATLKTRQQTIIKGIDELKELMLEDLRRERNE